MKDELIKNFGQGTAPANDFPSAAEPNDAVGLPRTSASVPRVIGEVRELPSLFSGEYQQRASNLPMTVSQSTILAENKARPGNTVSAPMENDNGV